MSELAPTVWERGTEYDIRMKGKDRHLSIYRRRSFYEAAWETDEADLLRMHSTLQPTPEMAVAKLADQIANRIRK